MNMRVRSLREQLIDEALKTQAASSSQHPSVDFVGEHTTLVQGRASPWAEAIRFGDGQTHKPTRKIPEGLLSAFYKTCSRWNLTDLNMLILLGHHDASESSLWIDHWQFLPISIDKSDRIAYVLKISLGLSTLYPDSPDYELRWLREPHERLNNKAPLPCMLNGHMVSLINVYNVVQHERGF